MTNNCLSTHLLLLIKSCTVGATYIHNLSSLARGVAVDEGGKIIKCTILNISNSFYVCVPWQVIEWCHPEASDHSSLPLF